MTLNEEGIKEVLKKKEFDELCSLTYHCELATTNWWADPGSSNLDSTLVIIEDLKLGILRRQNSATNTFEKLDSRIASFTASRAMLRLDIFDGLGRQMF